MRLSRALVSVSVAAVVALGACGGPEGRLDPSADPHTDQDLRIGADSPLAVSTTAPPQVVQIPDKPGTANCKLYVRPVGCFDSYQQLIQVVGGGIDMTRRLGG